MNRWLYVVLTAALAVAVAVWAIPHLDGDPTTKVWVEGNDLLGVSLATHIDSLAAQVLLLAVGVGLLVQIYSTAYLGHHPRYRSYALVIILFLLGMIAVVAADDLFVLLVGWEVMGLCSYLLIGHEWETSVARSGAAKAFLMTRIADLGLLVGILVIGQTYGTYRISEVLAQEPKNATAIGLLLLVAVVGKSAQFPLHTWLPDAMPGPTPITALDPRRDDGRRGRLPRRAAAADLRRVRARHDAAGDHRRDHDAARCAVRPGAERPQAGAGLVDGQPARVHVRGAVRRRRRRRHRPPAVARRVQGVAVPRLRLRHARRRVERAVGDGWPATAHARHVLDHDDRLRRPRRGHPDGRLLHQGLGAARARARSRRGPAARRCGARGLRRRAADVVHHGGVRHQAVAADVPGARCR